MSLFGARSGRGRRQWRAPALRPSLHAGSDVHRGRARRPRHRSVTTNQRRWAGGGLLRPLTTSSPPGPHLRTCRDRVLADESLDDPPDIVDSRVLRSPRRVTRLDASPAAVGGSILCTEMAHKASVPTMSRAGDLREVPHRSRRVSRPRQSGVGRPQPSFDDLHVDLNGAAASELLVSGEARGRQHVPVGTKTARSRIPIELMPTFGPSPWAQPCLPPF